MTKLFIVYATFLQVLVLIKINNQLIATYFYRSSALHNYIVHQLLLWLPCKYLSWFCVLTHFTKSES